MQVSDIEIINTEITEYRFTTLINGVIFEEYFATVEEIETDLFEVATVLAEDNIKYKVFKCDVEANLFAMKTILTQRKKVLKEVEEVNQINLKNKLQKLNG
jgi:hypothetical protein